MKKKVCDKTQINQSVINIYYVVVDLKWGLALTLPLMSARITLLFPTQVWLDLVFVPYSQRHRSPTVILGHSLLRYDPVVIWEVLDRSIRLNSANPQVWTHLNILEQVLVLLQDVEGVLAVHDLASMVLCPTMQLLEAVDYASYSSDRTAELLLRPGDLFHRPLCLKRRLHVWKTRDC